MESYLISMGKKNVTVSKSEVDRIWERKEVRCGSALPALMFEQKMLKSSKPVRTPVRAAMRPGPAVDVTAVPAPCARLTCTPSFTWLQKRR